MLNFTNLLANMIFKNDTAELIHNILSISMIVLMGIAALAAIILVLMQPTNSSGIDALGGSSETFFGKNKGKSTEAKMKKWTWICVAVLALFSIIFCILQFPSLWS